MQRWRERKISYGLPKNWTRWCLEIIRWDYFDTHRWRVVLPPRVAHKARKCLLFKWKAFLQVYAEDTYHLFANVGFLLVCTSVTWAWLHCNKRPTGVWRQILRTTFYFLRAKVSGAIRLVHLWTFFTNLVAGSQMSESWNRSKQHGLRPRSCVVTESANRTLFRGALHSSGQTAAVSKLEFTTSSADQKCNELLPTRMFNTCLDMFAGK